MVKNSRIDEMKMNGNWLCLDYLNTIRHRFKDPVESYLLDINDLLYWGVEKVQLLDGEQYALMEQRAVAQPEAAAAFFTEAMNIRQLLDKIFYPISQKATPAPDDLAAFNAALRFYRGHEEVYPLGRGYGVSRDWECGDFHQLIAPIVSSAFDLLTSSSLERVGACPGCGWVYLDVTKNGKRRWCSMEGCGSAAKAREYYHRCKGAASS